MPLLGINPGASYGSAKRWYPQKFAQVAAKLSSEYDIVIFGGPDEIGIAKDIEKSSLFSDWTATKEGSNYSLTALLEHPQVSASRFTTERLTHAEPLRKNPG